MRARCRIKVLCSEANPNEQSLAFLLSASSRGDRLLKSCAQSNRNTISLAIASCKRTEPMCLALQLFNAFAVLRSLWSRHLNASISVVAHGRGARHASSTTWRYPSHLGQKFSK
ncbi:hypothetical protein PVAP13_2NG247506 [Panicum virgatum]|uniref:Uncharacterized protein n=1 Tax=Panicum virgatum TaxID=38727 RepID=A0A8T0VEW2_PANVG|nr:hypothetical protein PVAP13_2NG247506 [Panicum virgatum]